MNVDAKKENKLTLKNILGLEEEIAERILGSAILISGSDLYPKLAEFLRVILERTFEKVHLYPESGEKYDCEVILDINIKRTIGPYVYVGQTNDNRIVISKRNSQPKLSSLLHPFLYFLTSCYVSGIVLNSITKLSIPIAPEDEIILDIDKITENPKVFDSEIDIGKTHLAGAGAIGNAFVYALSTFQVKGELIITDPDFVSGGNLNRCLLFDDEDISKKKANALCLRAYPLFKKLKLTPIPEELSRFPDRNEGEGLKKLVVAVDSRRTRRNLQREIPGEVYDASTTGIIEIVVHHHKRPLIGACLGCIYLKETVEDAHEKHVAETLGVSLEQVNQQFIDAVAASAISKKYQLGEETLVGLAYDTLFKQLCGESKLQTAEAKQVLAPLAFVSALAGAYLLSIEFCTKSSFDRFL
ncbi:MAG: ThiF family adenylyltransferase [Cyclobacteriaceae bacterium]